MLPSVPKFINKTYWNDVHSFINWYIRLKKDKHTKKNGKKENKLVRDLFNIHINFLVGVLERAVQFPKSLDRDIASDLYMCLSPSDNSEFDGSEQSWVCNDFSPIRKRHEIALCRVLGTFWKCARIGERKSPFVACSCVIMAFTLLFYSW